MEKGSPRDLSRLISELNQGKELTRQLETQIELRSSSLPQQCRYLVQSLLSTWDRAISMARSSSSLAEADAGERPGANSPNSLSGSPRSEGSEQPLLKEQESREMCQKRKALPQWTRRVSLCPGTGLEGPRDDGFSWRKYGQKEILGAKYPRGYYRCTHRHTQGCPATKQVQRSGDHPAAFDVTYRGRHTCVHRAISGPEASTAAATEQVQRLQQPQHYNHGDAADELLSFRASLTVRTEDLDGGDSFQPVSSFSFPSTSISWPSPGVPPLDSPFTGSFSPPFISPRAASEPSCFPESSSGQVGVFGGGQRPPAPESDLAHVLYGAASNAAANAVDLGFMLDPLESDPNFPLDPSFFA